MSAFELHRDATPWLLFAIYVALVGLLLTTAGGPSPFADLVATLSAIPGAIGLFVLVWPYYARVVADQPSDP